jgi:hypothetical protein
VSEKTVGRNRVGSLSPLLFILALGAIVFGVIPLAIGEPDYAIPAALLFCLLALLATTESLLARHQARGFVESEATELDGSLPLMTVEISDPFGGEDHAHGVSLHDLPPGHPARRALREAAQAKT